MELTAIHTQFRQENLENGSMSCDLYENRIPTIWVDLVG